MKSSIAFVLDGRIVEVSFNPSSQLTPTTTVLNYLRNLPHHRGVKEGCAEGDCGACTVVLGELAADDRIGYKAVDSCLVFLPMLHGKQLITVENLKSSSGELHPVKQALVSAHGSQCGFCTPGIVMTLFALFKAKNRPSRDEIADALSGNLCRCTGYRPIIDAAADVCRGDGKDHFTDGEAHVVNLLRSISNESVSISTEQQRYDEPATLKECLSLRERHPDAIVINGATDVALRATKNFEILAHIIDCSRISELREVSRDAHTLTIGAGVRMSELRGVVQKDFPAFYEMLTVFGAQQIRNLASLGGNIGTASPVGDILPVLIAYGAHIVLSSNRGTRSVPADTFVTGYRTTECRPDELITAIVLPLPSGRTMVRTYKVSKRRDLDIATVSAAFRLDLDNKGVVNDITLAYGGMADRIKRSVATEAFLK